MSLTSRLVFKFYAILTKNMNLAKKKNFINLQKTEFEPPDLLNDLIKQIYINFNRDGAEREIPTDDQIYRDVDKPLHCENQGRFRNF